MLQIPKKLETRRSHKVIQFFLMRSESWSKENRAFSIYWSTSHMITTAQVMRLLATMRGLDPDICAIAGAMHDVATMETGRAVDHAARSIDFIKPLLHEYNEANEKYKITDDEIALLSKIIPQHSNKNEFTDNPYVEILKDADALDRYLQGVEAKEAEMPRLLRVLFDLGIDAEFGLRYNYI
ncbi:MAG: HD domain-containing protein [Defluviitaleaceae bacterium]|nr:HD domain-containing protein [Defluviitaleaceae bacterium]